MSDRFPAASRAMVEAEQALRLARAAQARRRHLMRRIDVALGVCEEVNLGEPVSKCAWAAVLQLINRLQADAGRRRRQPRNGVQAHDELLRLQRRYVVRWTYEDDDGS